MQPSDVVLDIRGLQTSFFTKAGVVRAVDGVDIQVPRGKAVGLVGESGCGKSMTAFSVMGLVEKPGKITAGSIVFDGVDLASLDPKRRRAMSGGKLSIIFQEPMTSLDPVERVGKQVVEALAVHHPQMRPAEAKDRVIDLFRQVGIPDPERRYRSYPHELSGGLRQRVMIAMALANSPDLLIADEPTTALDVTIEAQILTLIKRLQREKGTSVLLISHNLGVIAEVCDYVYVMYAGQVVEHAEVCELFRNPSHPYTRGLLDSLPSIQQRKDRLYAIKGMVPDLLHMPAGCRFSARCPYACDACRAADPALADLGGGHWVRCPRALERAAVPTDPSPAADPTPASEGGDVTDGR